MPENTAQNKTVRNYLILVGLSIVWGSSFFLIKKALLAFSPVQVAALRIAISAIAFTPVILWNYKKIDWSKSFWLLIVGITGSALPAYLFSTAQTELDSSVTGILNSLTPLFTLLFGILLFQSEVVVRKIIGVLIGLAGAVLMVLLNSDGGLSGNILYGGLVVLAAMSYGINGNLVSHKLKGMTALNLSAVSFFFVGVPGLVYLLTTDFIEIVQTHPEGLRALGAVAFLSLVGTVIASIIFYQLIKITSPVFASMVAYLIPIIAILLGVFDGEVVTMVHFLGMGLILIGVYLSRN